MIHENRKFKSLGRKVILLVTFHPDIWPLWSLNHPNQCGSNLNFYYIYFSVLLRHFFQLSAPEIKRHHHWQRRKTLKQQSKHYHITEKKTKETFLWPSFHGQKKNTSTRKAQKQHHEFHQPHTFLTLILFFFSICAIRMKWLSAHIDLISFWAPDKSWAQASTFLLPYKKMLKYIKRWMEAAGLDAGKKVESQRRKDDNVSLGRSWGKK